MRSKFESWKKVKVGVLTWNLAGKAPNNGMDVSKIILPNSQPTQKELSLFDDSI